MITSLSHPLVKLATSLHLKKYRDEHGLFLVEGLAMIQAALQSGWQVEKILSTISSDYLPQLHLVNEAVLKKITKKDNPQSAVALFKKSVGTDLPKEIFGTLLFLEEIRDCGNLGTIMRSCHAVGAKHLILIGSCCDPFAPETIRASMGSFCHVQIIMTSLEDVITWKKDYPTLRLISTDVITGTDFRAINTMNSGIILGNEQKGVSPALHAVCDQALYIPMPGGTESLNIAMASTLILYQTIEK
jgi:TrmH family RNA methyltransferase